MKYITYDQIEGPRINQTLMILESDDPDEKGYVYSGELKTQDGSCYTFDSEKVYKSLLWTKIMLRYTCLKIMFLVYCGFIALDDTWQN